jgi:hypothetical protein
MTDGKGRKMTFAEEIDRLQRETAGCRAIVFGDLATATVLRSAAGHGLRQEDHDALLSEAARCLGGAGARFLAAAGGDGARPCHALLLGPGDARMFRRFGSASDEALCARLDGSTDLVAVDAALANLIAAHA